MWGITNWKAPSPAMKFEDLKLLPGTSLQLQFHRNSDDRKKSRLIGHHKNKSIIISTPLTNGSPRSTQNGELLNVRLFSNVTNSAIAFSSTVIHVSIIPYNHLHIATPENIVTDAVRKAVRVSTRLESLAEIEGTRSPCAIVDLSTSGCRIEAEPGIANIGDKITLYTKIDVADTLCNLAIPGEIKAIIEDDSDDSATGAYGISFDEIKDNVRLVLHAFVYSQLHQ
jgi:c-di-GMP-binding flagellar brake protein YcgR